MTRRWSFHVKGTAAGGQTWEVTGQCESDVADLMQRVMVHSFQALTNGKALYGHPGVACKGPYEIKSLQVERMEQ